MPSETKMSYADFQAQRAKMIAEQEARAAKDTIVKGSATVMIGKKPAARVGDTTAHGGSIALGSPTVMIGG
jgi:uncharacterized Zn-binding protein involved in type VI secretion